MNGMLTGSRVADLGQASPAFQAARDIMRRTAPLPGQAPGPVDVPMAPYAPTYAPRRPQAPSAPPRLGPAWTDVPEYRPPIPPADEPLYYGMPHVGPIPGGYLAPGLTREEAMDLEERLIERDILELRRKIWEREALGPTAFAPAGGGMVAFPGT